MFGLTPYTRNFYVASYDPFKEMEEFERRFFGQRTPALKTDIRETESAYILEADLPGFAREDVITYHWHQNRNDNLQGQFNFYYSVTKNSVSRGSMFVYMLLLFIIGIASVLLALEPNNKRIEGTYLDTVIIRSFPNALAMLAPVFIHGTRPPFLFR